METIARTPSPTLADIIQLLVSLLSTEDRHRILTEARTWFRERAPEVSVNPQRWESQPRLMRGPIGAVTQGKGGAAWRDIGQLFHKASRQGPETSE